MEARRTTFVRLDKMSKKDFFTAFGIAFVFTLICMIVGWAGPDVLVERDLEDDYPLLSQVSLCPTNAAGTYVVDPPSYCYSTHLMFPTRWAAYFDVHLVPKRVDGSDDEQKLQDVSKLPLNFDITWYGLKEGLDSRNLANWDVVYESETPVVRYLYCDDDDEECDPIYLYRTNQVPFETYFVSVAISDADTRLALESSGVESFQIVLRQRTTDFALFELGFKSFFMAVSIIAFIGFCILTGVTGACLNCRSRGSSVIDSSSGRSRGLLWMYAIPFSLFLFNDPFLWMRYYAKGDSAGLSYTSYFCQLSFVTVLLAFWLLEFSLLRLDGQRPVSKLRFYGPILFIVFSYTLVAMAVQGFIVMKMKDDPMFDWMQYAYDTVMSGARSNGQIGILVASTIVAGIYFLYLVYLIASSSRSLRGSKFSDQFLFTLHLLMIIVVIMGILAGSIYGIDVGSAFDLMFFNAIFNAYVYLMMYFYTPQQYAALSPISEDVAVSVDYVHNVPDDRASSDVPTERKQARSDEPVFVGSSTTNNISVSSTKYLEPPMKSVSSVPLQTEFNAMNGPAQMSYPGSATSVAPRPQIHSPTQQNAQNIEDEEESVIEESQINFALSGRMNNGSLASNVDFPFPESAVPAPMSNNIAKKQENPFDSFDRDFS